MTQRILLNSVENIAPLIQSKQISPVELTEELLDYSQSKNGEINAYISFLRKEAEYYAIKAEKEIMNNNYKGMYHGIPIGIKDNINIQNKTTAIGSKIHKDFIPNYNATVIDKLKKAGAIIVGKLNMHEYAWGITNNNPHFGACHNPWDLKRISGGSSGGSGASVAADMAFASLGTDTGGSIRIPASACGIVGLKPSYGTVSNHGVFPLAPTLDHVGPMAKTVRDTAGLFDIIKEKDDKKSFLEQLSGDMNLKNLVIGIHEQFFFKNIDKDIKTAVCKNIRNLINIGAEIKKIEVPSIDYARWAQSVILQSEFANVHKVNRFKRINDFGPDVQEQLKKEPPSVIDYLDALKIREQLKIEANIVFENIDVMIAPTLPITPPKIGDTTVFLNNKEVDVFEYILRLTGFSNLTGLPAISIPCGFKSNVPIGLQIIGPYLGEKKVFKTAFSLEQINDHY